MTQTALPLVAWKILSIADWKLLLADGVYEGSAVDRADGYIHLSAADQLLATASKHYTGQSDLMLVEVDLSVIDDTVVWEPSRGGALFPHIYGVLPLSATRNPRPLSVDADGEMIL